MAVSVSRASLSCVSALFAWGQAFAALPDITVDQSRMYPEFQWLHFSPNSCAIEEKCVDAPGTRRLLEFNAYTPNIGQADLALGDPIGNPLFEWSPCHNHFHFKGYAKYELLDATQRTVLAGRKQAFCVNDAFPLPGTTTPAHYHCDLQGISVGWADIYGPGLDCQWLDVTDIPPGTYVLRITVNPDRVFEESNYENNIATTTVIISAESFDGGMPDAGTDGGMDGGVDSGTPDAGTDGGTDAGLDAGTPDAGIDAGMDAGVDAGTVDAGSGTGIDSGVNAGTDAGSSASDTPPSSAPSVGVTGGCSCDAAPVGLGLWFALFVLTGLARARRRS